MKKRATQKKAGLQDSFDQKTIDLSRAETTTEVSPSVPSLESILKFKPLHDDQFLLLQGTQFLHTLQSGISENTYRNFSTLSRSHDEEETDHTSMRKGKKLCFTQSQNETPKQLELERKEIENSKELIQTQKMDKVPSILEVESCDEDSVGSHQILEEYESHYPTEEMKDQNKDIEDIVREKIQKHADRYNCEAQLNYEKDSLFGDQAEEDQFQADDGEEEEFEYYEPQTNFLEYDEEEEENVFQGNNGFETQEENRFVVTKSRYDDQAPLDQEWEF